VGKDTTLGLHRSLLDSLTSAPETAPCTTGRPSRCTAAVRRAKIDAANQAELASAQLATPPPVGAAPASTGARKCAARLRFDSWGGRPSLHSLLRVPDGGRRGVRVRCPKAADASRAR